MILNIYLTLTLFLPVIFGGMAYKEYRTGHVSTIIVSAVITTFGLWVIATFSGILYWIWS